MSATLELAQALIRRPSLTPADAGCQTLIAERLAKLGFTIEWLSHGKVTNLWARRGRTQPLFCFLGHTDVVPTGSESAWHYPPFQPTIVDGLLYGRGAADMKGSVAAFTVALERFLSLYPEPDGSLAVLLTSDEEGEARDGTRWVVDVLRERGESIDYCLVGEPSSCEHLGDEIKIGRRGSLTGRLCIYGEQGHVAYPDRADNPIHRAAPLLNDLISRRWDDGNEYFPPTSLQISNIHAGTSADNVIPGALELTFNLRYSPLLDEQQLREDIEALIASHDLRFTIAWHHSGAPFQAGEGPLLTALEAAITTHTGCRPRRSSSGGTSDGRFVAPTGTQVVELGPLNATIHKVNECVAVADLEELTLIYQETLCRLFTAQRPNV
ncbi:succinyl-diaminopimelate desuccinylase [Halorhodospira abdelmalekii]|uniref:succinyl-diaminopimelate desuccinylase n=1 Tax=Halorhodospira abdelmalekii TaxID=421629 RepID=UPI0019075702|nr:succinyl-diaminopimelate desuccinylase [Halorhodospira abdelmalekii]MBK1735099.1 succinyl-diaminopimelate desuccinylase [Halorhodospira abdelmalekii]